MLSVFFRFCFVHSVVAAAFDQIITTERTERKLISVEGFNWVASAGNKNETTDAELMNADGSSHLRIGKTRFLNSRSDDVGSSEKSI